MSIKQRLRNVEKKTGFDEKQLIVIVINEFGALPGNQEVFPSKFESIFLRGDGSGVERIAQLERETLEEFEARLDAR